MGKITIISSWDDYNLDNIRLANLLLKYEIPAIFFIECGEPRKLEQIKYLADIGFEIGSHTITHPQDLKLLTDDELDFEVNKSRILLQENTKQEINWFCYPRGRYNKRIQGVVKRAGYKYARTTLTGYTEAGDSPYAIPTSVHVYPESQRYNKPDWLKEIKRLLPEAKDGTFHLWGHSWEITKFGLWNKLEELLKGIKK